MYIPKIKVKPIILKVDHPEDRDAGQCLVNYQWEDADEWEDTDEPLARFKTSMIDCTEVDKCKGCILLVENLDIDYLVDKGYITKVHALELTLSGVDKN